MMRSIFPSSLKNAVLVAAFLLFFAVLTGCSEQERRGISPLPQNRPAEWELNPYGSSMRN